MDANDPDLQDIDKRLARISGHAASLRRLWQEGTDCDDILVQISAVTSALEQVGKKILQHHVGRCVEEAVQRGDSEGAIKELRKAVERIY
ncbi:MAG TPA: metal-sensing transcriptional repressor [Candidatus Xenobia bacterium]